MNIVAKKSNEISDDPIAASVSSMLAVANHAVREIGYEPNKLVITITQQENKRHWRISYCPPFDVNRRGGDVYVDFDAKEMKVIQVLRGQ